MRYVLLCLMVLYCGCSKFESVSTHQQQDYEWKDSFSIIKTKFQGELVRHQQEKTLNYLVGKTEVDGLPYGVTFVFYENELVSIFYPHNHNPVVNGRPSPWKQIELRIGLVMTNTVC